MLCLFSYGLLSATQLTDEMNEWETETETDRTGLDAKLLPLYGRIESIQAKETVLSAKSLTKIPLCLLNVSEFFEMCQHFSKPRHNIFCQMSWRFGRSLEMQRAYHIQSFQLQHLNRFWHTIYLDSNLKCFVECILVVKKIEKKFGYLLKLANFIPTWKSKAEEATFPKIFPSVFKYFYNDLIFSTLVNRFDIHPKH